MRRRLGGLLVFAVVAASACGSGGGPEGGSAVVGQPSQSPPPSQPAPDPSSLTLSPDDGAGLRLQQHVEAALVDALSAHGVTLDAAAFRQSDTELIARLQERRADVDAEASMLVGGTDTVEPEQGAEVTIAGFASQAPSTDARQLAPAAVLQPPTQQGLDGALKIIGLFMMLLVRHTGPGDTGPSDITVSEGFEMSREQRGSRITVTAELDPVAVPAGSPRVSYEIRISYDACPDEAGESAFEMFMRFDVSMDVPGTGVVSSELEFTATGAAIVDDDAKLAEMVTDIDASQATRTTAADGSQSDASYIEGSWSIDDRSITGGGTSVDSLAVGRSSSTATSDDYGAMATRATDFATWFTGLVMLTAQEGWSKGQCIELTVDMPSSVAPSSRTDAEATVEHRYEERVLQLPITAEVTTGGDTVDPPEASGDPATFTYVAPATPGEATLTFEVRSKRGADQKTVAVKIEAGVIDLTLTGTISYRMPGEVRIGGTVTIGKLFMGQYGGDDPEFVGKWVGEGDVEVALFADIPGCGAATGSQTGGRVTIVGTPQDLDGRPALALFSEEMEGGTATMNCGAAGAMLDSGGISIGAGLVNLGDVVIPLAPGTYPFGKSGIVAGVEFDVAGEALVEESADFPE